MPRQSVENRFERLERRVTEIEQLPARMDRLELQMVQLRAEMRDEFSAIRQAIQIGDEGGQRSLREEIRAGDEETGSRAKRLRGDEETRRALREEIRNGNVMVATALTSRSRTLGRRAAVSLRTPDERIGCSSRRPWPASPISKRD